MTEYLKQNSAGLHPIIQHSGCFFRAALYMAEKKTGGRLNTAQINALWDQAKASGFIDAEDNIVQSAPIANLALKTLGGKGRFVEVAVFKGGVISWYSSVPKNQRRADFFIQKGKQNGPQKYHFYNVSKFGEVIWDPHAPAIRITEVKYTICYRFDEE